MTEAGETVSVSGGKGVVVGDHNTVNQYYAAPAGETRAPSDLILTDAFASTIENRARGFVGREFVFEEVDRLLAGRSFRSGYIVIRGEPGIGKTAVASMLVRRGGYIHHFNVATANIRTTQLFLQNVCAQLIVRYDLDRAAVPEQATTDGAFLGQLLSEAAERARAAGTLPVVIVIDALDEALDTGLPPDVNRLYLPRALADGVFFVLTTREEHDYRLDVDNEADIWIRDDDPSNRQDVARYIEGYLGSNAQSMQELAHALLVPQAASSGRRRLGCPFRPRSSSRPRITCCWSHEARVVSWARRRRDEAAPSDQPAADAEVARRRLGWRRSGNRPWGPSSRRLRLGKRRRIAVADTDLARVENS